MHRPPLCTLIVALLWPAAASSVPVWRNIGPGGGWIQSICDVGGFYRSTDGGASYSIHNAGLCDYWVECIAPHPTDANVIYLGCETRSQCATRYSRAHRRASRSKWRRSSRA